MKKCPNCNTNDIEDNVDYCQDCHNKNLRLGDIGNVKKDEHSLRRNVVYGTRAREIYKECCYKFSWDIQQAVRFGPQQLLYAQSADSEGLRSIWFISNSNWTETSTSKWQNRILGDTIEEDYINGELPSLNDRTDRIIFAKNNRNQYMFLGVYTIATQTKRQRIYKLISEEYPI